MPPPGSRIGRSLAERVYEVNERPTRCRVLRSGAVSDDVVYLSATRQAELIRAKQVPPVERLRASLDRIDRLDARLRAYITVTREAALAAARQAEDAVLQGARLGPLHGVAFAVKDQFATRGVRTTAGSRILADNVPDEDATVVARLTAAGGILLGKLNLTEVALGRTVEDCALVLRIIAGHDPRDPLTTRRTPPDYRAALTGDINGLRVGVIRELTYGAETDPEMRDAVLAAIDVLARLGAAADEVSLPLLPSAGAAFMAICDSEGAARHLGWLRTRPGDYDQGTRRRLLAAGLIPAALVQKGQQARALVRAQVLDALARFDVLVAPTSHRPAPAIAAFTAPITSKAEAAARFFTRRSFTTPAALAGTPAMAVPCGFSASGLPLSLQIIGRRYEDATVLRVGHAYEQATEWHRRRPTL